jgi:hypothetical protein
VGAGFNIAIGDLPPQRLLHIKPYRHGSQVKTVACTK